MELSQIRLHREQVQEALDAYHKAQKEQDMYNTAEQGEKILLLTTPYDTNSEWHSICKRIEGELEQLKKTKEAEEDEEVQEYSPGKLQYPPSSTPTLIQDNDSTSDWLELSNFEEVTCHRHNNKGKKPQHQVRCQKCLYNLKSALKKA
jgi:Rad3-related DNA helicase